MKAYSTVAAIRTVLPKLKTSRRPGVSNDGQLIQIRYEAAYPADEKAKRDTIPAKKAKLDLRIYTGVLDKVFKTKKPNPQTCFTMLVLERLDSVKKEYGYRTFNLHKGRIRWLKVI